MTRCMIWDKPIRCYSVTVHPDELQAAWDLWFKALPCRACELEYNLDRKLNMLSPYPVSMRCSNRMIQEARKAGVIVFDGKVWRAAP